MWTYINVIVKVVITSTEILQQPIWRIFRQKTIGKLKGGVFLFCSKKVTLNPVAVQCEYVKSPRNILWADGGDDHHPPSGLQAYFTMRLAAFSFFLIANTFLEIYGSVLKGYFCVILKCRIIIWGFFFQPRTRNVMFSKREQRLTKSQAARISSRRKNFVYSCNLNIFVAEVVIADHSLKININR